ncbi:hypothetical protein [Streptomyces showdoensis]|uniref:Lipoprotein n=1 Tax=Streptomyces showdoensis TaxID=68268 RepID=A0A2P2GI38_STREW|nr:hypothetical protein [Streptomyces showdoensis]KKZ70519.1 lipoprotein [Streptomyces showdoensis]
MGARAVRLTGAAAVLAAVLLGALALAGCGNQGALKSAGPTPEAVGPVRLWPDLPPATNPPIDYGESDTERVPGIDVPDNDVHSVDAVAVVQAEVRAHGGARSGADGLYEETVRAIGACTTDRKACPVLAPYYRDLTGNGRDELIVGIRMPDQQLGVRVYLAENGGLTRIMSTVDQVVSVELAGRDLIMRVSSAGIPGYEYRTAWSWDEQQRTMLPARDEIVRVKPPGPGASVVPAPAFVSPSTTPAPATPPPAAPGAGQPDAAPPEVSQ